MTATETLRIAAGEIGYYAPADPEPGSKYGRWAAEQLGQPWLRGPSTSVWWCMLFASWAVYQSGGRLPGGVQFNTDRAVSAARAEGRLVSKGDAQPGDLAIFDWNMASAATDHVGIIEQNRGSVYQTIEGNTSSGTAGSQSAGNGVHRRVRSTSLVRYVIRPYYEGGPASQYRDITGVQAAVRAVQDNIWGPDTDKRVDAVRKASRWGGVKFPYGVRYTQQVVGTTADNIWGPNSRAAHDRTVKAIQAAVGATPDCVWGNETESKVQAAKAAARRS